MKKPIIWGPLKKYIEDMKIHEIIVDSAEDSIISYQGGTRKGPKFKPAELMKLAQCLMLYAPDPKSSQAEILLPGNILVAIVMPPIAPGGPFLRIWKIPQKTITLEQMVEWEVMSKQQKDYIKNLMQTSQSIIVAGSAGSGKITLLSTLINCLPEDFHLVSIEQYADLSIQRSRTVRFIAPHHKAEELVGLVDLASRARGDYLILNSAQGAEILPFIELLREGHQGVMSLSGENVFDVLKRLEYKVSANAPWMSLEDIRFVITKAFGHIVFQTRENDGKRKLSHLARLELIDGEIKVNPVKL